MTQIEVISDVGALSGWIFIATHVISAVHSMSSIGGNGGNGRIAPAWSIFVHSYEA